MYTYCDNEKNVKKVSAIPSIVILCRELKALIATNLYIVTLSKI